MDNKTISNIFVDVYNRFWMKWRDRVPPEDSGEWDESCRDHEILCI